MFFHNVNAYQMIMLYTLNALQFWLLIMPQKCYKKWYNKHSSNLGNMDKQK